MKLSWFQFSENKVLLMTLSLVGLMAIPTFFTIFSDEESAASPKISSGKISDSSRSPSSIGGQELAQFKPTETKTLQAQFNVQCSKSKRADLRQKSEFIQLQGEPCVKNFQAQQLEIINKRNGYTASIFPIKNGRYQTDLIQLEPGENEILVRYLNSSGQFSEEIFRTIRD